MFVIKSVTRSHLARVMMLCSMLGLIVSACGVTKTSSSTPSSTSQNLAIGLNTSRTATVGNIQLLTSITCGPWLVLTPHAPTYTQDEVTAMHDFVSQNVPVPGADDYPKQGYVTQTGFNPDTPVQLPPTLAYIPGDRVCEGSYEVTNTGSSLVQINKIGIQLTQPVAKFSYDYHLVDACSLGGKCACGGCGAQFLCLYTADIPMTLGDAMSVLGDVTGSGADGGDPSMCPVPVNLEPGNSVRIITTFAAPPEKGGYWFRGSPAVNISSAQGNTTLTYPSMPLNLNFVDFIDHPVATSDGKPLGTISLPAPGTCYAYKNHAFSLITQYQVIYGTGDDASAYAPICV